MDKHSTEPSWIDRHSVGCYFCGILFDEREGLNADEYNNDDGGVVYALLAFRNTNH